MKLNGLIIYRLSSSRIPSTLKGMDIKVYSSALEYPTNSDFTGSKAGETASGQPLLIRLKSI